jgi:hypothetical protein
LADKARKQLLAWVPVRRTEPGAESIAKARGIITPLYAELRNLYGAPNEEEQFVVSLMAYDASERRLVVADGLMNGGEPGPPLWNFWLPFGLGLAGACFKQGDRPYMYIASAAASETGSPNYYIPMPKAVDYEVLVAIPLRATGPLPPPGYEPSRQCVAVLCFGSNRADSQLRTLVGPDRRADLLELAGRCEAVFDLFCGALP